jgi:catechol 2,3-dioxygenase-like lactoylglutathione lyase family enzyme
MSQRANCVALADDAGLCYTARVRFVPEARAPEAQADPPSDRRYGMRVLTAVLAAAFAFGAAGAAAPAVQSTGFHNVHLRVPDPAAAADWYVRHLGAAKAAPPFSVEFGRTLIAFVRTPAAEPSEGSVVDHIGLSYPDLAAKMKEFEAAGARIIRPMAEAKGMFAYAYIQDPWGVKIEVMQDTELLGFHHVHLSVPDPAATLTWFHDHLGGERAKLRGILDGVRYGPIWLFASRSAAKPAPSASRAIMSLAVEVPSVDAAAAAVKERGIALTSGPAQAGPVRYAFLDDPNGVRVELVTHSRP